MAIVLFFNATMIGRKLGADVDFTRDVQPILAGRCFKCHGPDDAVREAGLRLDRREPAIAELESGDRAIVPGDPQASMLLERVGSDDEFVRMPPPSEGDRLSETEVRVLHNWIASGADFERHWSFVAPDRPNLPAVSNEHWCRTPIDRFVLARLDRERLVPSPPADRYTWIRRVTLDLTGLPPTIKDADRFVDDDSPDAYERVVDRLLSSPAYGERWARVWLDLARYADSAGYADDPPRIIWKYRDWVIKALNDGMPFDQFTIEQLAGDLLPEPTDQQLIATAFHRNTMTNSEGGTDDEEFRNAAIVDRVNTTLQVWMGLTMGCAQCHTHKYDPISQEDFYRVFAILNQTEDADLRDESPLLSQITDEQLARQQLLQSDIRNLKQAIEEAAESPEVKRLQSRLKQSEKQLDAIKPVTTPILRELPPDQRRKTHIQVRGNFLDLGPEVTPGVPVEFHPLQSPDRIDRRALADWLLADDNPLTARVIVNRHWEQLFGIGLVATSEDFGLQGSLPSHPEMLDWLAVEFRESGWDMKSLVRLIVTSATYRQASIIRPERAERDPENRLLARGPRFRLPAERIRDQALAVGGLLSRKMHGPSVYPPRPNLGLKAAFGKSTDWEMSAGEDRHRRGLYTFWQRSIPYPSMDTFDAPSREVCTLKRIRTNTPLQALVTLNDPVYVEAAQGLARRVLAEAGPSEEDRAEFAFRLCLTRPPTASEREALLLTLHQARVAYLEDPDAAGMMATEPIGPIPEEMSLVDLAAWTVVGNVLLNLDETLARP